MKMKPTTPVQGKYTFKRVDERRRMDDRLLLCPGCGETISQADIEAFARCPFCNHKLEQNLELEDFILEPIVDHWMRQQTMMLPPFEERLEDGVTSSVLR